MSRGPSTARKSDMSRVIDVLKSKGIGVARIEIQPGKIILFPDKNGDRETENSEEIKL
jgi:hypothetical protein